MLKRSLMFLSAAAASFVVTWLVVWFVLVADPHLQPAYATTSSTAVPYKAIASEPFKMVYAALTKRRRGYLYWIRRSVSLLGLRSEK